MSRRSPIVLWAAAILASFPPPSNAQWQSLGGPGGRSITTLAASGKYLFAGTPFGIFVSADDGANWTPAGATGSAASGEALTQGIYPFGPDIFARTQSGLYSSRDNGVSWTAVNSGLPEHEEVTCLVDDGGVLFCGLQKGGIYRSTDRGAHWMMAGVGLTNEEFAWISSLARLGQVLYVGYDFFYGIYCSGDSGASWAPMLPALPGKENIEFLVTVGRRLLAGTGDGLFAIEDGAKAWSRLGEEWGTDRRITFLASSGEAILAGLEDGRAFLSMDAGASWAQTVLALAGDEPEISGFAAIGPRLFVGIADRGLIRSDDLGATWAPVETGFPSPADIPCIARMGGDLFTALRKQGAPGSLLVKTAGGPGWESLGFVLQEDKDFTCLETAGTNLIAGTEAGLFVSDDRGRSWSPVGPESGGPPWVYCLETVGARVFACTSNGILMSTDLGRTWLQVFPRPPQESSFECLVQVGGVLLAGGYDGIYLSRDRGETWTRAGRGISRWAGWTSLATDGKVIVAGVWPSERKKPRAVEEDPALVIAAIETEYDIAISTDEGQSWRVVDAGLPEKFRVGRLLATSSGFVASLESTYTKSGRYSAGLFLSTDGGMHWTSDWPGYWSAAAINDFLVEKDEILVATLGAGIWRLPLSALKKREPGA
jgi:photosystem II stability/assembly factor-like uncharacterized protein